MTGLSKAAIVATASFLLFPPIVDAQPSAAEIAYRLAALEHENQELRARVQALEIARDTALRVPPDTHRDIRATLLSSEAAQSNQAEDSKFLAPDWTGLKVSVAGGGSVGSGREQGQQSEYYNCIGCSPPSNIFDEQLILSGNRRDTGGAFTALTVGYDVQIGDRVVLGLQVGGDFGEEGYGSKENRTYRYADASGVTAPTGSTRLSGLTSTSNWSATAVTRGGVLVAPTLLAYGLAGWTAASLNVPASYLGRFDDAVQPTLSNFINGPTVGAGIEYKLSRRLSVFGEYRFTSYAGHDFHYDETFRGPYIANGLYTFNDRFGANLQNVRFGITYWPVQ